jgi:hypothetical protein
MCSDKAHDDVHGGFLRFFRTKAFDNPLLPKIYWGVFNKGSTVGSKLFDLHLKIAKLDEASSGVFSVVKLSDFIWKN